MTTLQQRIEIYLRENAPLLAMQVAETTRLEYDLERAETELRAAQERVKHLKKQFEASVSSRTF